MVLVIAGAACQDALDPAAVFDDFNLDNSTRAACGWLIFVGVIALLYEALVIVLRFLNIGIVNYNIKLFLIVVSSYSTQYHL